MPISAPTAPGIYGAAPVQAAPNNGGAASVPTTAPTEQTSTSSPPSSPATPTAVVSSAPAVNQAQTIKNTVAQGTAGMAAQSAKAAVAANPYSVLPGETTEAYNTRITAYNASKSANTPATPTPQTPEEKLADTPDTGNQWIYDAQGNRTQVPITDPILPGFSKTNPHAGPSTPVADSTTDPVGNVYKQFTDGTYGKYNAAGVYVGAANQNDFNNSKTGEGLVSSIAQVANGTYPLTPVQQSQVDGLKAQFQQLVQAQQTANANFTGGTTVAENLYGMGNSLTGLGEIKGTVDAGIAKIADLNSKLASSIATMEAGFQTDDMTLLKGAYDVYSQAVKDRQSQLDIIQAAAQKALVDAQTAARDNETLKLTKMMDDNTISYQAKEQALAQSTLDEKTKDDIQTQQLERLKYNLDVKKENFTENQAKMTAEGSGVGDGIPSTQMTAAGVPDPVSQAQLLNSLPGGPDGDLATNVKGLANYTVNPTDFTVRTLKGSVQIPRDKMVALAQKYDPSYDDKQYSTRQSMIKSLYGGGVLNQKTIALNTASSHLATLAASISKLGNVNFNPFGLVNGVKNAVGGAVGAIPTSGAKLTIGGVTGELATAFKQAGATDAEIKSLGTIDSNSSPADIQSYITNATDLMGGKLQAVTDAYTQTMGKAPDKPLLNTSAQTALSTLKNEGYQIDVPGVQYTDKDAYIKNDPNAQANMSTAIKQLQDAGLPLTPENILQMAQSQ